MHAGLFDVLHDAGHMDGLAIRQGVNVTFDGTGQVAVQQNRAVARDHNRLSDVAFQLRHVAHDFHRTATQHVGRADHQRETDVFGDFQRFGVGRGDAVVRLLELQLVDQRLEAFTVFGQVNRVGAGAEDRNAFFEQRIGQLQRGLAAELNNHTVQRAVFLLNPQDFHHVLKGQRFKIQTVRGVIVGRHGLGVAVDHDGFITGIRQRVAGMTAAVVKLDPLTDPVWTATQNNHFLAVAWAGFAFHVAHRRRFVGRIHVGGLRLELGGAGVDAFEHGLDAKVLAGTAHVGLGPAGQDCQAGIGEAQHLQGAQTFFGHRQTISAHDLFGLNNLADAVQEPRIKRGDVLNLGVGQTVTHCLSDGAQTVRCLFAKRLDHGNLFRRAGDFDLVKTGQTRFHRSQRFLQTFVDGAADRHCFTHGFHRGGQVGFGAGEFLKGEFRDLGDNIVDGRLERGRGHLGDVIVQLIQRVANGQLGRDFCNREAGRLGGQRRGTRHPRVHFDHNHPAVCGVHRPLHVGATGFHANLAQNVDRVGPHDLVFFVGQRQRRGHGDRITCVDAHRVNVFDRADNDGVVGFVAHNLHLVFFPAQQAFVDEDLVHRRGIHAGAAEVDVIFAVIGYATAGAAKGEGGADDGGQANLVQLFQRLRNTRIQIGRAVFFLRSGDDGGLRVFDAQTVHRFAEQLTIFSHFNGIALGADHFHVELVQHAHLFQRQRGVQTCLTAHGRQQRVGALFFDDLGNNFGGDRLDIGGVGQTGVGHNCRRVRVHEDHAVALFSQRLTGLGTGVVEFTRLTDNNRTSTDNHDRGDVSSFGHGGPLFFAGSRMGRRDSPPRKLSWVIDIAGQGARGFGKLV